MTVHKSLHNSTGREERISSFVDAGDRLGERHPPPPMPVASLPVYTSRERLNRGDNSSESDDAAKTKNGVGRVGSSCPLEEQHQGKELLNTHVMLPIDTVFNLMFIQEQFMVDVYNMKKTFDVVFSSWQVEESGQKARQVTYVMTISVSNLVSSKVSNVTEKQVIQRQTQPGQLYIVEVESVNSGIPYADAFYVFSHYCLAREDDSRTRIIVWASVKYRKSIWGMMRGVIEKNTYNGMEAVLAEVMVQLVTEEDKIASPAAGVRRRRRAGTSTSINSANKHSSKTVVKSSPAKGCNVALVVVLTALVALVVGNFVLYTRLRRLEHQYSLEAPLASSPANHLSAPGSWEAVARILQRQELLHQHQLDQWRISLKEASRTLVQVQELLENVLTTLPNYQESLEQTLQQENNYAETSWPKDLVQDSMQTLTHKHEDSLQQPSQDMAQDTPRQEQGDDSLVSQQ